MLVASLEWRVALRRRRVFALNVLIPLVLVTPVALSTAPAPHAAAVYTVLFVLFGTFGSAIPLIRDAERGLLHRVARTGLAPRRLVLERVIANTLLDAVQLLPALAVIAAAGLALEPAARPEPVVLAWLPAILLAALAAANVLGALVAAAARSIAEGALFAAVVALFSLHAGGVFRTPAAGSRGAALEPLVPFRYLHEALLAAAGAPARPGSAEPAPALLAAGAALGALAALAACAALARVVVHRLTAANPA